MTAGLRRVQSAPRCSCTTRTNCSVSSPSLFAFGPTRSSRLYSSPYNPLSDTWFGKSIAASAEIVARLTQNYGKPAFGLKTTQIGNETVAVNEEILLRKPFCQLLRFHRDTIHKDPKVLLVAPMSGHFATLLRGTVEALLPEHDVHITDWVDAREVPLVGGQLRPRRLRRLCHRVLPLSRARRACHRRLPAFGAGAGRRLADGAGQGSAPAALAHPDGRPDRHSREPDHAERPGDAQLDDVVPPERDLDGAVQLPGRHAPRLSGLPAAHQLHHHESRPAHQRPHAPVRAPGQRRRRFAPTATVPSTTNISR